MKKQITTEEFINRSNLIHNFKYDYSLVEYINIDKKVIIICKIHGEFLQTPHVHLGKHGCKKCSYSNKPLNKNFIQKAKLKHNNKYDYSLVQYINNKNKVIIICPEHGEFLQQPNNHLNGVGCPKCKTYKYNINNLINKFNKIHKDRYDYSKVNYINSSTKISIICPEHGEFLQLPSGHLNGYGCNSCYGNIPLSTEKFIEKAIFLHGNKYGYNLVNYKNKRTKVIIICPEHGEFLQNPLNHLSGDNCKKCYFSKKKSNTEEFIKKAKEIYGDKYDYSKTIYYSSIEKITFFCFIHGECNINSANHLQGQGCKRCSSERMGWNYVNWKKRAVSSKYFNSFKVYVIRCWNKDEEFYKIGKTFLEINKRFKYQFPYNYEIIKIYSSKKDAEKISKLEKELQNKNYQFKYIPKIKFNGMHECFSKIVVI